MPYHLSNLKRFALVLFLGGSFIFTNRKKLGNLLCEQATTPNSLVEFGPFPMMPDVPLIPSLEEKELFLSQQQELIEQLRLKEDLLKELKEKTDKIGID